MKKSIAYKTRQGSEKPRPWKTGQNVRWNGEPAYGRKVYVRVGSVGKPTYWYAGMEGTRRKAVEVEYEGQTFFLDNEDGQGWHKVTAGLGSPQAGHLSLPNDSRVVGCDHWFISDECVFCDAFLETSPNNGE